jgi:hypothetical protein
MPEARRSELHFEEEHQLSTMRPSCIKREAQLTLFEKLDGGTGRVRRPLPLRRRAFADTFGRCDLRRFRSNNAEILLLSVHRSIPSRIGSPVVTRALTIY